MGVFCLKRVPPFWFIFYIFDTLGWYREDTSKFTFVGYTRLSKKSVAFG